MKDGILLVNKPSGMTSHDVVSIIRRKLDMKQVGHAGTLDPMATGVLVILVGRATKLFDQFVAFDKAYRATLRLGIKTTSADITGQVTQTRDAGAVTREKLLEVFQTFKGDIEQLPPMVSAVKHKGQRLYKLARQGKTVERIARKVKVHALDLVRFDHPDAEFLLECSKGTYVRQIAEDVGDVLGCGACISQIERTRVGPYKIEDAVKLEDVHERHLRAWGGA